MGSEMVPIAWVEGAQAIFVNGVRYEVKIERMKGRAGQVPEPPARAEALPFNSFNVEHQQLKAAAESLQEQLDHANRRIRDLEAQLGRTKLSIIHPRGWAQRPTETPQGLLCRPQLLLVAGK